MQDPLNVDIQLEGLETSLPLLPDGDYAFQVVESSIDANKDKNGLNWNLKLALTNPATAVDGRDIQPNFPVFAVLALQAKADSKDVDAFRRSLGEAIDAIYQTDKTNRPNFTRILATEAVGKLVTGQIYIDQFNGRQSNKVKRLKPATGG